MAALSSLESFCRVDEFREFMVQKLGLSIRIFLPATGLWQSAGITDLNGFKISDFAHSL